MLDDTATVDKFTAPAPPVVPIEVTEIPKAPKTRPPYRCIDCHRIHDGAGDIIGLDLVPQPGNAITRIELRDLKNGRWRVGVFTQPRRGRAFKNGR